MKRIVSDLTRLQIAFIFIPVVAGVIFQVLLVSDNYDSFFYHYQNTRWNEEYAVVPGLANIESRFGFNSNYLLLSAMFSLRSWLGEQVFLIQSILTLYIIMGMLLYIIKSKFEIKGLILLVIFTFFYFTNIVAFSNSSTDIIPALAIFYLTSRLVLRPDSFKGSYLLYVYIPVALVTFKLSCAPFAAICLYALYFLIKNKEYKYFILLITLCLCIIIPWLVRNAIISGYLIYPLYQLDLFSFDWKVPRFVAELEQEYIRDFGWYRLNAEAAFNNLRWYYHLEGSIHAINYYL